MQKLKRLLGTDNMNLQQAKALLFHQYWGQEIFLMKGGIPDFDPTFENFINGGYLLLRAVKQLTDEEIIKMCQSIGLSNAYIAERDAECIMVVDGDNYVGFYTDGTIVMYKYEALHQKPIWNYIDNLYQSLKALGVLTKFTFIDETGKPVTLPVEEIIALNWAKIKTD